MSNTYFFNPIDTLLDLFFEDTIERKPRPALDTRATHMRHSFEEHEKSYTFKLVMPGVSKNDLSISIDKEMLLVKTIDPAAVENSKGENKDNAGKEVEQATANTPSLDFSYNFSVPLPADADTSAQIIAELARGILTITIAKQEAKAPKQIEILELAS